MVFVWVWIAAICSVFGTCWAGPVRPIRIALAVDDHSFKDLIILINSVVETAESPDDLVFHVVACGKDLVAATGLKHSIVASMEACLPTAKKEVVPFALPLDSGFALQLANSKKISHWNSKIGADMVRFYLASLFPTADRLLYLDNDIIVGCCLEEIFDTDLGTDKVIGIALDDLKWATVTQFGYHYNASHPLVIRNMRRKKLESMTSTSLPVDLKEAVSNDEFYKALPRYPNDGVLLIDVKRFNERKILQSLEEIAFANARGEYVVNLGTQQFTVLTMWDRWVELTPRANLRHFPDMARGYLMWFFYNGFIHYAGQSKPRAVCQGQYDNPLRVQSYTAWATSNAQVAAKCGHDKLVYAEACVQHIPVVTRVGPLVDLLAQIIDKNRDETLEFVHIGPVHGDLTLNAYHADTAALSSSSGTKFDLIEMLDRLALHNSSWSYRGFDCIDATTCDATLNKGVDTILVSPRTVKAAQSDIAKANAKAKKKGVELTPLVVPDNQLRFGGKRNFLVLGKYVCAGVGPFGLNSTAAAAAAAVYPPVVLDGCETLVDVVRAEGKKHWDVVAIVIDKTPLAAKQAGTNADKTVLEHRVSKGGAVTSLRALLGLDLIYMRPKLIVVRLMAQTETQLAADVLTASRFLSRNGFNVHPETEGHCTGGHDVAGSFYSCIWGTRLNTFELITN